MDSREIPPLSEKERKQVHSLLQVQAMIRHGARAPFTKLTCWPSYHDEIKWNDCNVTELMITTPNFHVQDRPVKYLYRKIYDGSETSIGGNCMTGQLLSEGYEQELRLGNILRNAYLSHTLGIFHSNQWKDIDNSLIYFRSDDKSRTLMSGQIAVHGMFDINDEIIVDWHTGDYNLDQIYPNAVVCPRLNTISNKAFNSHEWLKIMSSNHTKSLESKLNLIFGAGYWTWLTILDCIMTTLCTGHDLPDGDGHTHEMKMNDTFLSDIIQQVELSYAYKVLYNDSLYSKLAMGNTAWHIKKNILEAIETKKEEYYKFVLYSAHDTSIMPLLASLLGSRWDGRWAGYASMVTIELYNSSSSMFYFRVVYNGEALILPGCDSSLCDANILIDSLYFAQEHMPCSESESASESSSSSPGIDLYGQSNTSKSLNVGFEDLLTICILSSVMGCLVGAAIVLFSYKRQRRETSQIIFKSDSTNEDSESLMAPSLN